MKRRAPWPLPKLLATSRNALTVYGTLRYLAGDTRQLSTTRGRIRAVCGLSEDTVSQAMTALDKAGWVRVGYGRFGNRTWYRLVFPVPGFFPCTGKKAAQGGARQPAKRRHREPVPCTGKKAAHSLKGVGPVPVGPYRLPADGPTPGHHIGAPVARSQDLEQDGPARPIADIAAEVFGKKGKA